jgi:hypothetical protein
MTWKSQHHLRLLLSSAAMISLVVAISCDARAAGGVYSQYCPAQTYVDGKYVCLNFAQDFQKNCQTAGQQSWIVHLGFTNGDPKCNGLAGHAFNVVTAPSCDLASDLQRYCAVEPQNGKSWCWTQNAGDPSIPSWVMQNVGANLGGTTSYCVGKGQYLWWLTTS